MRTEHTEAALQATAELITADDALAEARGIDSIPADEVVVEPSPADYRAPDYLSKTAPDLKPYLDQLLSDLCDLNSRFAGTPTLRAQAQLSFSGEHEETEEYFLRWCQKYFERRGSLDNLSPEVGNDPWRLYQKCYDEFDRLLGYRIGQVGTLNSVVLNLSRRYMRSAFACDVLGPDLAKCDQQRPSRFGDTPSVARAAHRVGEYVTQVAEFTTVMDHLAANLPSEYAPAAGAEWKERVRTQVARQAEDLNTFRHFMTVLVPAGPRRQQLAPDLWAGLSYDVYHGRSVAMVLTSKSPAVASENSTDHLLSFRRDGWLCHRELSWIRVEPESDDASRLPELAVSAYVLDTLTRPLYEAWLACDIPHIIGRGTTPNATEDEQNAALAAAVAASTETDEGRVEESFPVAPGEVERDAARGFKLGVCRVRRFAHLLRKHFGCVWSSAKGSELKVTRDGGRYCNIRHHGRGDIIWPEKMRSCLDRLDIPVGRFIEVLLGRRG